VEKWKLILDQKMKKKGKPDEKRNRL